MPSLDDTLTHLAELAVALAGFVGVVSAFAGRNRDYTTLERGRTIAVGVSAGSVLAGSLAHTTISTGGFSSSVAIRSSAAVSFLLIFVVLAPVQFGAAKALISRQAKQPWVFAVSLAVWSLNLALLGFSIAQPENALALVAAFSIQLLVGFWMFMRLLLQAD